MNVYVYFVDDYDVESLKPMYLTTTKTGLNGRLYAFTCSLVELSLREGDVKPYTILHFGDCGLKLRLNPSDIKRIEIG